MKSANQRRLERLQRQRKASLPTPEPDMTGWSDMEAIKWHAENGTLIAIIEEVARTQEQKWTAEKAARIAAEDENAALAEPAAEIEPVSTSDTPRAEVTPSKSIEADPVVAAPGQPPPDPAWWSEYVRWRMRDARDYDWVDAESDRPEVLHEYDPLE